MGDDRDFAEFVTARMAALLRRAHLVTGDRARAEGLVWARPPLRLPPCTP